MNKPIVYLSIDFGTSNSCAYSSHNGRICNVTSSSSKSHIPSSIFYRNENEAVIGDAAEILHGNQTKAFVRKVKRIIGLDCSQECVKKEMEDSTVPIEQFDNYPRYVLTVNGNTFFRTPVEIASELFKYILKKVDSENAYDIHACITVPATFFVSQTEAVKKAAVLAGLKNVHIVAEPVAAVVGYSLMASSEQDLYLVYDLGGGTFDATIVKRVKQVYSVMAKSGDPYMGGCDIDSIVYSLLLDYLRGVLDSDQYDRYFAKLSSRPGYRLKLLDTAREAKESLSSLEEVTVPIEMRKQTIYCMITRSELNKRVSPLITQSIQIIKEMMKKISVSEEMLTTVIMVGGPTQYPYFAECLQKEFGDIIRRDINVETVVAQGALAIEENWDKMELGRMVPKKGLPPSRRVKRHIENVETIESEIHFHDCLSYSIGIRAFDDSCYVLFHKSEQYNAERVIKLSITQKCQKFLLIEFCQGESNVFSQNTPIGSIRYDLKDVRQNMEPQFELKIRISQQGTLMCVLNDLKLKQTKELQLNTHITQHETSLTILDEEGEEHLDELINRLIAIRKQLVDSKEYGDIANNIQTLIKERQQTHNTTELIHRCEQVINQYKMMVSLSSVLIGQRGLRWNQLLILFPEMKHMVSVDVIGQRMSGVIKNEEEVIEVKENENEVELMKMSNP